MNHFGTMQKKCIGEKMETNLEWNFQVLFKWKIDVVYHEENK